MARTQKQIIIQTETWLDERWAIVNMGINKDNPYSADMQYYKEQSQRLNGWDMIGNVKMENISCLSRRSIDMVGTKEYFSKWFDIILKHDAKMLWEDGDRSFLVLASDGSERYADCFETWEDIEQSYPNALFGLEREVD